MTGRQLLKMRESMFEVWLEHNPGLLEFLDAFGVDAMDIAEIAFERMFWSKPFGMPYEDWAFSVALKTAVDYLG